MGKGGKNRKKGRGQQNNEEKPTTDDKGTPPLQGDPKHVMNSTDSEGDSHNSRSAKNDTKESEVDGLGGEKHCGNQSPTEAHRSMKMNKTGTISDSIEVIKVTDREDMKRVNDNDSTSQQNTVEGTLHSGDQTPMDENQPDDVEFYHTYPYLFWTYVMYIYKSVLNYFLEIAGKMRNSRRQLEPSLTEYRGIVEYYLSDISLLPRTSN